MKSRYLLILVLCCGVLMAAQTFRGSIQGTVTDASGAIVSGATVTVANHDTGFTRTVTSNEEGEWRVSELPIGVYDVTSKAQGFQPKTVKGIRVEVSVTARADAQLAVGPTIQTIEINDAANFPLVTTTENNLGGSLQAQQIEELPVSGRERLSRLPAAS